MKTLNRIRYFTNNSCNLSQAPAYNLKIYNIINNKLRNKVYEMMETDNFYEDINCLIEEFDINNDYIWQAGFNGRSGGYLVLYRGGRTLSEYKSYCPLCGQKNFTSIKETGKKCGHCGKDSRIDKEFYTVFSYPGKNIEDNEVPSEVLKAFRRLAIDIVKDVEYKAKHNKVKDEEYIITKHRKVLI